MRIVSAVLMEMLDWINSGKDQTEFEKGFIAGMKVAECVAEVLERNSDSDD